MTIYDFTYGPCPICQNPLRTTLGPVKNSIKHHNCKPFEVRVYRQTRSTRFTRITP